MARSSVTRDMVVGLDIGSSAVRVAVGQITHDPRGNGRSEVQIIGAAEAPSEGVHKGSISSIEESVSSISRALEEVERMVGVPVEHAWIGMSGAHILSQHSKGVVAAAKSDGEIGEEDVERAVEAARTVTAPLNYEVIHVIPHTFTVDGQTGIKDPIGMTGIRLEVDAEIIFASSPHVKNLTKAVYRTGIDIDDIVLSVLAVGDVALTGRQKDLGVVAVDIGSATTTLVVYEEGTVKHLATLPIGSDHVTNDLALGLQTSIDIAERVKIQHGHCTGKGMTKRDTIDLASLGAESSEKVAQTYIVEIIEARMMELLEKVDGELAKIDRSHLLPAGVVFSGGGAKIPGLVELAKQELGMNAALGYPIDMESISEKSHDLAFTTAIGLVRWGASIGASSTTKPWTVPGAKKVGEQFQKLFKFLVP